MHCRAHALGSIGRFQLEAAIQSVHCARATTGVTDWDALRTLYTALLEVAPTLGARVSTAAVVGRLDGPAAALAMLDEIGASAFQPWWATRAWLLAQAGRPEAAAVACAKAISLTTDATVRAYLVAAGSFEKPQARPPRLAGSRQDGRAPAPDGCGCRPGRQRWSRRQ